MAQFPANIDLSSLNGNNGLKLSVSSAPSVASAGDVNGDGFADVIIGDSGADPHGAYSGASYVVFGKASGFAANLKLSSLNGSNGFKLSGVAPNNSSGSSVASAGDVNGDGFADLIVGAPNADPRGRYSGASYVVFGKASGFPANLNLSSLNGNNGFELSGVAKYDNSGDSVASAGDVNGDGFADLIVGAPNADPHGAYSGASYVVFGKASGFPVNLILGSLNGSNGFRLSGVAAVDHSGSSVAPAGDVNGDGFDDVIVGAPFADPRGRSAGGASYVVFGKASGFAANIDLSSLGGKNGFRLSGEAYDWSGTSVASAGDVNGDGFADLIVGAYRDHDPHGFPSGASYVVFGKASGFTANLDLSSLNGSNGFKLSGVSAGSYTGWSVASAGDVNGDGFADLIVGAPWADPHGRYSGQSYVVFGKASGFAANLNLSSLNGSNGFKLSGVAAGDHSGWSVASAGDVNRDGFADLVVSDFEASYVIYGRAPDSAVNRTGTAASQSLAGGAFDDTLSGAGGDDHLFGNGGGDMLEGDAGNDSLYGDTGDDLLQGHAGSDILWGGADNDRLDGSYDDDRLHGEDGDDVLIGGKGNDLLDGGAGIDTADYSLYGASGVVVSLAIVGPQNTGSGGFDTLVGIENLRGTAYNDRLTGDGQRNVLDGAAGDDRLTGGGGDDVLIGGAGNDSLDGGDGMDRASYASATAGVTADLRLEGQQQDTLGAGLDTLSNIEKLRGSIYSDRLYGNAGANLLDGGDGDDVLEGDAGNDLLAGGAGQDTALYVRAASGVTVSLLLSGAQQTGEAGLDALLSIENLRGSNYNDRLTGNGGDNVLSGRNGNDVLQGSAGNDTLLGGNGNDTLVGGFGRDIMTGGAGADTYRFNAFDESGITAATRDQIVDFEQGTDSIDLSNIDADITSAGNQAFAFIGAAAFHGIAGELRRASGAVTLVIGDINGDSAADFQIQLNDAYTLTAGNFSL